MSSHTKFTFESELAGELFTTQENERDNMVGDENEIRKTSPMDKSNDRDEIAGAILNRKPLPRYTYCRYTFDRFVKCLCCCYKRGKCYKKSNKMIMRDSLIKSKLN